MISNKVYIYFLIFIACGVPQESEDVERDFGDQNITINAIFLTTDSNINNTFELSISAPVDNNIIFKDNNQSVNLNTLAYGQTDILIFKIDNWFEQEICYSPTYRDFDLTGERSGVIYFTYNHQHNTVYIYGDSILDLHISINEKTSDFWRRNDESFSANCQ